MKSKFDLYEQHAQWINAQKDMDAIAEISFEKNIPYCLSCGCMGDNQCGHACLDEVMCCALDSDDCICACCHKMPSITIDGITLEEE